MTDAERTMLTNILGHIQLAASEHQAAYAQLRVAEDKLQRLLAPSPAPEAKK